MNRDSSPARTLTWQARIARLLMRIGVKPVLRVASWRLVRRGARLADWVVGRLAQETLRPGGGFRAASTPFGTYVEPLDCSPERIILYLPGGAFLTRTPNAHRLLVQRLCAACGAHALMVNYRLAPEHPYPAALEDARAAWDALLAGGTPPGRVVVAGDSAGGGLALSLALALRDAGAPLPGALVLLSPLADLSFSGASRRRNRRRDPLLPANRREADARLYLRDHDPRHPLLSPVFGDFRGLPPLLAQVGSDEILLDDTQRLVERARAAEVRARAEVWEHMPHVWQLLPQLPESAAAIAGIARFVRAELPEQVWERDLHPDPDTVAGVGVPNAPR